MINKCIIVGRIVYDLEIKKTPNDTTLINNVVAVDRMKKSSQGEKITDFIPFTVWGKSAEYLCNYGTKGDLITIEGSLRVDSYQASDGTNKKKYYINAENVNIIFSGRKNSEEKSDKIEEFIDLYVDNDI